MPNTPDGRIIMAKLDQKLTDHAQTQAVDMNDLKTTMSRIEAKLDIKANKDDVDKLASMAQSKADRDEVNNLRTDLQQMRQNQWGIIVAVLLALIGAFIGLIRDGIFK